jgi:hypothetical protein
VRGSVFGTSLTTRFCNVSRNSCALVVFNERMKRVVTALAAIVVAAILVPALATAQELQIGVTASPLISPTCPAGLAADLCTIVLTQVTAYETRRDGIVNPTVIKKSGVLASFTVGLSGTSTITGKDITYLNKVHGGPAEVQLTVLQPTGTINNPSYRVAAESPVYLVRGLLGQIAEFPLVAPLPVVRGEVVALTVPTWAPVLSFDLDKSKFSYSQSRTKMKVPASTGTTTGTTTTTTSTTTGKTVSSCNTPAAANLAQLTIGQLSNYTCNYPGTRVEYSALEITTPAGFTSAVRKRAAVRIHS